MSVVQIMCKLKVMLCYVAVIKTLYNKNSINFSTVVVGGICSDVQDCRGKESVIINR